MLMVGKIIRIINYINIKNIDGNEFKQKYGFKCPVGVRGRNSDNTLYKEKMGVEFDRPLQDGINETYKWIEQQIKKELI